MAVVHCYHVSFTILSLFIILVQVVLQGTFGCLQRLFFKTAVYFPMDSFFIHHFRKISSSTALN